MVNLSSPAAARNSRRKTCKTEKRIRKKRKREAVREQFQLDLQKKANQIKIVTSAMGPRGIR